MQVCCPKCYTCYELDDSVVNDKQRKLRCSKCKEVFVAGDLLAQKPLIADDNHKEKDDVVSESLSEDFDTQIKTELEEDVQDVDDDIQDNDDPVDLEKIFARLSEHTESLIEREKKLPIYEKVWFQIKNVLGFHFKIRWFYVFIGCAVFVLLSSYNNRYQIVRNFPVLNSVYKIFGIKAKIPGEGLEFGNISWDFISEGEETKLEIKGFVNNTTIKEIAIPMIHIEILDKNTVLLQSQNRKMKEEIIGANSKVPLNLTIKNPAPTAKYVYLTFIDND